MRIWHLKKKIAYSWLGFQKGMTYKKKIMKDKFHNVYKYYNHHFLLVFTNKILSD